MHEGWRDIWAFGEHAGGWMERVGREGAGLKCRRERTLGSGGNRNAAVKCRDENKAVVLI